MSSSAIVSISTPEIKSADQKKIQQPPPAPTKKRSSADMMPTAANGAELTLQDFFVNLDSERDGLIRALRNGKRNLMDAMSPLWELATANFAINPKDEDDDEFEAQISDIICGMRKITYTVDKETRTILPELVDCIARYFENHDRGFALPSLGIFLSCTKLPVQVAARHSEKLALDLIVAALKDVEQHPGQRDPIVQRRLCQSSLFTLCSSAAAAAQRGAIIIDASKDVQELLRSHSMSPVVTRPLDMPYFAWTMWVDAMSKFLIAPKSKHAFQDEMAECMASMKSQFEAQVATILKRTDLIRPPLPSSLVFNAANQVCDAFRLRLAKAIYQRVCSGVISLEPDVSSSAMYFDFGSYVIV